MKNFSLKKFGSIRKSRTFALANQGNDQVAQPVEHIPFKDGVLGSSPSLVTDKFRKSIAKQSTFFLYIYFLIFNFAQNFPYEKIKFFINYFKFIVLKQS